jgi:hypothetical protein
MKKEKKPSIYSNHDAKIFLLNGDTIDGIFKPNLLLGGLGYKKHLLSQYKYGFKIDGKKTFFEAKDIKGFSFTFNNKFYNIISDSTVDEQKKTFVELIYEDHMFRIIAHVFSNPFNQYDMYPCFYHCLNKVKGEKTVIRQTFWIKSKNQLLKELFTECDELESQINQDFNVDNRKEAQKIDIKNYMLEMIKKYKTKCIE